jgi:hypothetical protein
MTNITNKDLAITFIKRYREFCKGEKQQQTFSPEQLQTLTFGLRDNPVHMVQFIGDVTQHVSQILAAEGEPPEIIMEAVLNCNKILIGFLVAHLVATTRPDIVHQVQAQEEFSWEEELKGLDFKMPQIGTLQLDS